nr:uncharacterized protein LOC127347967 [Lolium perenne]
MARERGDEVGGRLVGSGLRAGSGRREAWRSGVGLGARTPEQRLRDGGGSGAFAPRSDGEAGRGGSPADAAALGPCGWSGGGARGPLPLWGAGLVRRFGLAGFRRLAARGCAGGGPGFDGGGGRLGVVRRGPRARRARGGAGFGGALRRLAAEPPAALGRRRAGAAGGRSRPGGG